MRAIAFRRRNADAHRYYARWLADHGRGPEALAQYAIAISRRPEDLAARREQLLLAAASGDADATRAGAAAAILAHRRHGIRWPGPLAAGRPSVSPVNGVADRRARRRRQRWYLSGWALTRVNRHAEAIQAYRQAVAADSTNVGSAQQSRLVAGSARVLQQARPP